MVNTIQMSFLPYSNDALLANLILILIAFQFIASGFSTGPCPSGLELKVSIRKGNNYEALKDLYRNNTYFIPESAPDYKIECKSESPNITNVITFQGQFDEIPKETSAKPINDSCSTVSSLVNRGSLYFTGKYTCQNGFSNAKHTYVLKQGTYLVMGKDYKAILPTNETSIEINCSATGNPTPIIELAKNGEVLSSSELRNFYQHTQNLTGKMLMSTLTIPQPDAASKVTFETFTCLGSNGLRGTQTIMVIYDRQINKSNSSLGISVGIIAFLGVIILVVLREFWYRTTNLEYKSEVHKTKVLEFMRDNQVPKNNQGLWKTVSRFLFRVFKIHQNKKPYELLEICRSNLTLDKELSSGEFGSVWKAVLLHRNEPIQVAVKKSKRAATGNIHDPNNQAFLREMRRCNNILRKQNFKHHENVVRFYGGVIGYREEHLIVVEYCEYRGHHDLKSYLRANFEGYPTQRQPYVALALADAEVARVEEVNTITDIDLTRWCYQIANGMDCLANLGIIHRDVAARNILIDSNGVAKVADFGLSRELKENLDYSQSSDEPFLQRWHENYYRVPASPDEPLPQLWLAPEIFTSGEVPKYTTYSDVWSFSITMWEIYTLGIRIPYQAHNISNESSLKAFLDGGKRLERPENLSDDLFAIMESCWAQDPPARLKFSEIKAKLLAELNRLEHKTALNPSPHFISAK